MPARKVKCIVCKKNELIAVIPKKAICKPCQAQAIDDEAAEAVAHLSELTVEERLVRLEKEQYKRNK